MDGQETLSSVLGQIESTGTYTPPAPTTPPADTTTPPAPTTNTSPTVTVTETPASETANTTPAAVTVKDVEAPASPEQIFNGNKQNAAFAKMRTENKTLADTVLRLGKTLGIEDTSDIAKVTRELEARIQAYEAQQSNVPLPVLQKLEETKRQQLEQEQELNRTKALQGFQKVKDTYGLDDAKLQDFATKLYDQGKNPFTDPVDLLTEYKILYYDELMEKTKQEAIAAERARTAKVNAHSSAPNTVTGAPPGAGTPVKSSNDMVAFLKSSGAY